MKHTLPRRRKGSVARRRRKHKAMASSKEMEELFYMYSSEDLPEIEADLYDHEVKPEISRDYYL